MKLFRYILPIAVAAFGFASTASAGCGGCHDYVTGEELNNRDFDAVVDYVKTKRMIPLREKGRDLMITGDIRVGWSNFREKHDDVRRRGSGASQILNEGATPPSPVVIGPRIPRNEFDVDFNLWFDYKGSCTWAVTHMVFANEAGIDYNRYKCCGTEVEGCAVPPTAGGAGYVEGNNLGDPEGGHGSGFCNNICLVRAYFGYNIFAECNSRLDIEIGRRPLWDIFDSRVQFKSRFDGILLRYSNYFDCVGDFYINGGAFVVDYSTDHFGWVLETGLLNICDYGFDFKYSIIDWKKGGENRCDIDDPIGMRFLISQFSAAYHFDPEWLCAKAKIYGAFLVNHFADATPLTNDSKKPYAWYVGFLVGDVRREGDWHIDVNYQYVEAQAIPDFDVSGIGRGNVKGYPFTLSSAWGNVNYHGFRIEGLYALTDNLGINPSFEWSQEEDSNIGGTNDYSKFELQFIYAF